jgi:uncharacterized protein YndB with AHSA1/START domain
MTTQELQTTVTTSTTVKAPIERAFEVFTTGMGTWWREDRHILQAELAEMVFEPHVGGRIVDLGVDGSECVWGRVLAYEPPDRVVFSWDITTGWTVETDPAKCSEVEVRFFAETPGRTRVELEHRELQRHGDGWESMRDAVGSPDGWAATWETYVPAAQAA